MCKKNLFCILFILIFLIPAKQDPNAKTWERHNTTVSADSILAAIDRGDSIIIDSCGIYEMVIGGSKENRNTINAQIQITNSVFYGGVLIAWCHFLKQVRFVDDSFKTEILFVSNICNDWIIFARDVFSENALIWADTFNERAGFEEITFSKDAIFAENVFKKGVNFRETEFKQEVDFSFSEFKNIYVTWDQLDGHLVFYPPFHYELIRHFEEQRQLDDADGAYLFLKDHERMEKRWYVRYPEYWFIQQTCGYGVEPLLPFRAGLVVVALFAIPYYLIKIREPKWALGAGLKRICIKAWNAFYFSLNTFVNGAPIEWTPEDTRSSKRHYLFRILITVERIFGWILLVLFVVTLTRKFIR
jgi:hypothetical protein